MNNLHTFHIPVMGTGFTLDTPVKVARFGIDSVISLVDDTLIEEMRKYYCEQTGEPYVAITKDSEDPRARRITAYLNLLDRIVRKQFAQLKASAFETGSEITRYFELLPETSPVKLRYLQMLATTDSAAKLKIQEELRGEMRMGGIDVNIMTKLDRPYFAPDGNPLAPEFSDALAALRGYAQSTLQSAIVFSAGINQRLYTYAAEFKDFYADTQGFIKKKIILKVSDYRSSIIQGKFFAKKGLWISEFRVESGLNCGGHAFATTGYLMGPILEEFKTKRQELADTLHKMYNEALKLKNLLPFAQPHAMRVTAQGGIGTAKEDEFLRTHYQVDSTGWGTPFLLCPEAINVDAETAQKLAAATEEDLYLSDVSPLGVPFNNLRGSASDLEKELRTAKGRPGSACPKGHLASNTEFTAEPLCTASRLFQKLKLDQLKQQNLPEQEYREQVQNTVEKSCICHDLGQSALIKNAIPAKAKQSPAVCPGPNLAYFSRIVSLNEIIGHIYGRINILNSTYRPNMFIKELQLYIDYLIRDAKKHASPTPKQQQYFVEFKNNLLEGIEYYRRLFPQMVAESAAYRDKALEELNQLKAQLEEFASTHPAFSPSMSVA